MKLFRALFSLFDPGTYLHVFRLLHYFHYSHVSERRKVTAGPRTGLPPNISFRHGERISIGRDSHIGERCYLWAGPESGCIKIGNNVSLAPEVFITASDYSFKAGVPFRQQPKRERDIVIGNDVWLGTRVVVTAGVTIGDGCIVGAGAVVTRDLPPGCIAVGVPAKPVGDRKAETSK